jgi:hypothetical protein
MIYEMQKKYPQADGFEVLYLRVGTEADYIIVRNGLDYRVFYGSRTMDPSLTDSEKLIQHEMIPKDEFIRELKSYKGGKLLIR